MNDTSYEYLTAHLGTLKTTVSLLELLIELDDLSPAIESLEAKKLALWETVKCSSVSALEEINSITSALIRDQAQQA